MLAVVVVEAITHLVLAALAAVVLVQFLIHLTLVQDKQIVVLAVVAAQHHKQQDPAKVETAALVL
jgi:hypothetical protein